MAAAATFTVHIKTLTGGAYNVIDIDGVDKFITVDALKQMIDSRLTNPTGNTDHLEVMQRTSPRRFVPLENDKTLDDYNIDATNNILYLFVIDPRWITVHIRDVAGNMMHFKHIEPSTPISILKRLINIELRRYPEDNITKLVLTHMDNSAQGFTILQNSNTLADYHIDYKNDELNLIINDAAKGGRRRKRTTKSRLSKRHRKHRTHRK
jgi:hypothetical protein